METREGTTESGSTTIQLSPESGLFIKVPQCEARCSSRVVVQSTGGSDPRVEFLGAPLFVDVSYYLVPGEEVTLFSWTNTTILIQGSPLLLRNVFKTSTKLLIKAIVEYHCLLHEARVKSEKGLANAPVLLLCGRDDSPKVTTAKSLCNYATRTGWKPLLVDLDSRRSPILGIPGSISASVVEFPITLDEVFSTTHVSITFFVGSTEPQHFEEGRLSQSYIHYTRLLLSCCNDRILKHKSNIFGSSGMIIVVPELRDNAGVNFITELVQTHGVGHILTFGDDYLFHKLCMQYPIKSSLQGKNKVLVDRFSKGHYSVPFPPLEQMLSSIFHNYFHGSGPIILQPFQWLKTFEMLEILRFQESMDQVKLVTVEKEELQAIVGCIGGLFYFNKITTPLNSSPFAYVRVHSIEPTGVSLLTTTPFTFASERLILLVGTLPFWNIPSRRLTEKFFITVYSEEVIAPMLTQDNLNTLNHSNEQLSRDLNTLLSSVTPADSKVIVFLERNIHIALERMNILANAAMERKNLVGFFRLEQGSDYPFAHHVLYVLSPDVERLSVLVAHLLSYVHHFPKAVPQIYFSPQKSLLAEKILENDPKLKQSFPDLKIGEFEFDMVWLMKDILSMEQPRVFKDLVLEGDITSLKWIARLLLKLQTTDLGIIPVIRGKGQYAAQVVNILEQMQDEVGKDFIGTIPSEVESLYIVDRTLDLVTPLMTQLTYEGLIEEIYGSTCGEVVFPFSLNDGSPRVSTSNRAIVLDSRDKVFSEIRDKNFVGVGSLLYQKSIWLKNHYDRRKEVRQLKELKEFMKGLPEMQEYHRLISLHTVITSEIAKIVQGLDFREKVRIEQSIIQQVNDREVIEFLEDMICRKDPLVSVLRILTLYSLVNGGVKTKDYDSLKEFMMLSYGIPQITHLFDTLEMGGLLTKYEGKTNYALLRKKFRTWNSSLKEEQPNDIAYAYSGYASLLVRLFEKILWSDCSTNALDSILDLLPGKKSAIHSTSEIVGDSRTMMFFVIGGLTASELSSVRFIQSQIASAGNYRRIIVATTNVCSGKQLMESIIPFDLDH